MDIALTLIFAVVFLCSFLVVSRPKSLSPGPLTLPLLGSYWFMELMRKKENHIVFADAAKNYGSNRESVDGNAEWF